MILLDQLMFRNVAFDNVRDQKGSGKVECLEFVGVRGQGLVLNSNRGRNVRSMMQHRNASRKEKERSQHAQKEKER